MLSLFRILIIFIAAVVGLLFGYLNFQSAPIDLLVLQTRAPLVILLAVSFVLGLLIAMGVFMVRLVQLRARLSGTKRKLKDAEAEIDSLRSTRRADA
ncbi:LapA family protein [uncultured Salinisphaera sp.]|uniref:LapA family protein n=1 Tax=uncultured Salinisphaera sp. TaxID=359372 RepID=UPI0032B17BB6|tara:strand:- start:162 stop:452 length:291 start_codon:yes stop_codon:yes gene_type:complete